LHQLKHIVCRRLKTKFEVEKKEYQVEHKKQKIISL
jgi:hypothetical protein